MELPAGWEARCLRCGRPGEVSVAGCQACSRDGVGVPVVPRRTGAPSPFPVADPRGTAMAVHTVRASGGDVVCCDDAAIWSAWRRLAARGTLVEMSSAAALCGAEALAARGELDDASAVVLVVTAGPHAQASATAGAAGVGLPVEDPASARELSRLTTA